MEFFEPLNGKELYDFAMEQYHLFGDMPVEMEFIDLVSGEVECAVMSEDGDPNNPFTLESLITGMADNDSDNEEAYTLSDQSGEEFWCSNVRIDIVGTDYIFIMECIDITTELDYEEGNEYDEVPEVTH